jgi:hypothetical protein
MYITTALLAVLSFSTLINACDDKYGRGLAERAMMISGV